MPASAALRVSPARWLRAAIMTTRPRQWPKNLLVFAAPLAGASLGRDDGLGYALRRHVRLRLRVGRGLLRQRRRRRRAGPAAPGEAEPADRLGRAAGAARGRARGARGAVRGRRGRGDPRAAARRHGVGVPVLVVPLLVQAQARPVRRDADRGVRVRAAGARRRGRDAREAVGLVPAGVQPRRARRDGGQAVHRADQPGRGRGQAPPGDALVPAGACCASRRWPSGSACSRRT